MTRTCYAEAALDAVHVNIHLYQQHCVSGSPRCNAISMPENVSQLKFEIGMNKDLHVAIASKSGVVSCSQHSRY